MGPLLSLWAPPPWSLWSFWSEVPLFTQGFRTSPNRVPRRGHRGCGPLSSWAQGWQAASWHILQVHGTWVQPESAWGTRQEVWLWATFGDEQPQRDEWILGACRLYWECREAQNWDGEAFWEIMNPELWGFFQ